MRVYTDDEKRAAVVLLRDAARIGFSSPVSGVGRVGMCSAIAYARRSRIEESAVDWYNATDCGLDEVRQFKPVDVSVYWFPLHKEYDALRYTILLLAADKLESEIGEVQQ